MKQAKVLTANEMKRLLAVVAQERHADRNRLILMLSYLAGLRVGEIASLRIGDVVDRDGNVKDVVYLNPAQTKGAFHRTVFLNAKLRKELERYVKSLSALPAPLTTPDQPLIRSQKGGPFSANSLCQLFSHLYRKAGIEGASSHSGRRSFITKLAHSAVSAKVIMELAGHRHLATTQRYIDVNDEMKRSAVELLS